MHFKFLFFLVFSFLFHIACKKQKKVTVIQKEKIEKQLKKKGIKVWIYDFDPIHKTFQFKKENTGIASGDPLRIAIRYFLDNNHLNGSFKELSLERIGMRNKKTAFIFSGRIQSEQEKKDLAIFKMALDSTITRNYFTKDYSIIINGKSL